MGSDSDLWPQLESQAQPELQTETEPTLVHNLAPAAVSILASDANARSRSPSPASELAQESGPELMKEEVLVGSVLASELHLSSDSVTLYFALRFLAQHPPKQWPARFEPAPIYMRVRFFCVVLKRHQQMRNLEDSGRD